MVVHEVPSDVVVVYDEVDDVLDDVQDQIGYMTSVI